MKNMRKQTGWMVLVAVLALGLSGIGSSASVQAQAAQVILVVDQQRIIETSSAGKNVAEQAKKMRDQMTKEVRGEAEKFQKAQQDFLKNREVMSPEQQQQKARELQQMQINLRGVQVQRARELQQSLSKATNEIAVVLRPILEEIVEERNAALLVDRDDVMYVADEYNITDEVLARLDKKLKRVKLERISSKN